MTQQKKEKIVEEVLKKLREPIKLPIQVLEGAHLPFYAHKGDAGLDLRANTDAIIKPMKTIIIPTGIKLAIPEGYEVQIRPRSGISAKTPLRVALGTIDSGYHNEIGIIITNYSPEGSKEECTIEDKHKFGIYNIKKGDRIAQMVFTKYTVADLKLCEDIDIFETDRSGGFGTSGVK